MSRELIVIIGLSFGFALFLTLFIFWVQQMRDAVPDINDPCRLSGIIRRPYSACETLIVQQEVLRGCCC